MRAGMLHRSVQTLHIHGRPLAVTLHHKRHHPQFIDEKSNDSELTQVTWLRTVVTGALMMPRAHRSPWAMSAQTPELCASGRSP